MTEKPLWQRTAKGHFWEAERGGAEKGDKRCLHYTILEKVLNVLLKLLKGITIIPGAIRLAEKVYNL